MQALMASMQKHTHFEVQPCFNLITYNSATCMYVYIYPSLRQVVQNKRCKEKNGVVRC